MRIRATAASVIAAALVAGGGALLGATASADPPDQPAPAADGTAATTVTLVTGDRVTLTTTPDGRRSAAVQPGPGREDVAFVTRDDGEHLYVIPTDVGRLVPERLDRALFDVAGLVAGGYGTGGRLPVIVQEAGAGSAGPLSDTTVWQAAGLEPQHRLESVGAVSTDVGPESGAALADVLAAQAAGTSTRSGVPRIEHVWLDATLRASDADSMPQIGAPAAWAAGHTGEGVRLAVLDTGIDATHPDLAGRVVASKDFAGTGGVADGQGHGTHVASIAAGSGTASDGANKGVAPGADLMVGKVLDDAGAGEMSWVIDGMEWAATQGADVVNLSLGSSEYTDGTDPAAVALDTLTREHGTLFVVAAGNAHDHGTIATPGSASSALTVGAVDDADQVTAFSSRGPRGGDGAIKPDVVAPGDGIVAARGAGTELGDVVDDLHTALSGTSMATPHVAGAAAALLQARPGLTPAQAKAALMGSAAATGGTVWDEGAGRIDVPAAIGQEVLASPASVSLGLFAYPHGGSATDTITYANGGAADVTLDLAGTVTGPDGTPAAGLLGLSRDQVTVPAGGTATVDVTVDRTAGAVGRYSGVVVATGADGAAVRTPVGWEKEPELFEVTVRTIGRDGQPHAGWTDLTVMNVDDLDKFLDFDGMDTAERTFRVPRGTYSITGTLVTADAAGPVKAVADVLEPELTVNKNLTVTLDAREALPVSVTAPRSAEPVEIGLDDQRLSATGPGVSSTFLAPAPVAAFVTPTRAVAVGRYDHVVKATLAEPVADGATPSYLYDLAFQQEPVTTGTFTVRAGELAAMRASYAAPGEGMAAQTGWGALPPGRSIAFSMLRPVDAGTSRTEFVTAGDVRWFKSTWFQSDAGPQGAFETELDTYAPGSEQAETFGGAVHSPVGVTVRTPDRLAVTPGLWVDADGHGYSALVDEEVRLTVWQDGELVAQEPAGVVDVPLPAGGAGYRVALEAAHGSGAWATSPEVSAEWTFRAEPGSGEHALLDVSYDVAGIGLDGRAPAETEVALDVTGADGDAVVGLSWSDDDGATWHPAEVTGGVAAITAPATAGHVSLRAEVSDAAGNTVTETVRRAYLVG
ncbi:S8 family serine peptidase [Myceligenerans crystallogenes]|uniref:Peptidase S8/S53 domain-containing protein n=1 Tax=Myceligenerans crystallogenes TaxID=316335 RepID=A0ABN2N9G2_9MICO